MSSEDEVIPESQDQNITSSQNEIDTLDINESIIVAESLNLCQSNDVEIKGNYLN